jgi:hypothetical protein
LNASVSTAVEPSGGGWGGLYVSVVTKIWPIELTSKSTTRWMLPTAMSLWPGVLPKRRSKKVGSISPALKSRRGSSGSSVTA